MSVEHSKLSLASSYSGQSGGAQPSAPPDSREAQKKEARVFAEQGWTVREIRERYDICRQTARRWMDPIYDEKELIASRLRKDKYRGTCVVCGKRTDGSNGPLKAPRYCTQHAFSNPNRKPNPKSWSKEQIIAAIHKWNDLYGEPPAIADWNSTLAREFRNEERALRFEQGKGTNWPWFSHVVRNFGSWNAGIEAAGFKPRAPFGTTESAKKRSAVIKKKTNQVTMRKNKYWTRERILEAIQDWNAKYNRPPKANEWFQPMPIINGRRLYPDVSTVRKEFGSWSRGIRAAGLKSAYEKKILKNEEKPKKKPYKHWEKEEIITLMQEWAKENYSLPPSVKEWSESSFQYPSQSTVFSLFGSWNEAVKAAGLVPRPQGLTKKAIKRYLPLPRERSESNVSD